MHEKMLTGFELPSLLIEHLCQTLVEIVLKLQEVDI